MDAGPDAIADDAEVEQVRRQARAVHYKALIAAAVLTVAVFAP